MNRKRGKGEAGTLGESESRVTFAFPRLLRLPLGAFNPWHLGKVGLNRSHLIQSVVLSQLLLLKLVIWHISPRKAKITVTVQSTPVNQDLSVF